jgi:hypothetical protein
MPFLAFFYFYQDRYKYIYFINGNPIFTNIKTAQEFQNFISHDKHTKSLPPQL